MNYIQRYRALSFEQKMIVKTVIGLIGSAVLASGKLLIGIFYDYNLCGIAVYTIAILLSKLECLLGIRRDRKPSKRRNALIALFLFVSSLVYIVYMSRRFFYVRDRRQYEIEYVLALAFISFAEFGFAIAGLIRTKRRGQMYRNIKIINFGIALIAILTTQITILDFQMTDGTDLYNAYTSIAVGSVIALSAVYILFAPKICVNGREHNVFLLQSAKDNHLIDMGGAEEEIMLAKSTVYGSYVYRAQIQGEIIDGYIVQEQSLWKRLNPFLKVICCIMSEILLFIWLFGRAIFFFRTLDLPRRLEKRMIVNGFVKGEA